MTRVAVDADLCQGHAMCELDAPDVFAPQKAGPVRLLQLDVTPENEAAVRAALRHCPTQALSLEES